MRWWQIFLSVLLATLILENGGTGSLLAQTPAQPQTSLLDDPLAFFVLLDHPGVQAELQFSQSQQAAMAELQQQTRQKMQALYDTARGAQTAPNSPKVEPLSEQIQQTLQAFRQEVSRLLQPSQVQRLQQIVLQRLSALALSQTLLSPGIATALTLTPAQQQQLRTIAIETRQVRQARRQAARKSSQGQTSPSQSSQVVTAASLQQQEQQKALAVLNATQQAQWQELLGQPFDLSSSPQPSPDKQSQ